MSVSVTISPCGLSVCLSLLDFWLRMGFEDMKEVEDTGVTPIDGVMEIPLPSKYETTETTKRHNQTPLLLLNSPSL